MTKVVRKKGNVSFDDLKVRIAELDKLKAFVGWLDSAMYDDSTPVAGIAAVQEYGSVRRGIPPRPFFRVAIDENTTDWMEIAKSGAKAILRGESSAEQVMNLIGLKASGDVKNAIVNVSGPPLSMVTIALRKHRNEGTKIGGAFVGAVAAAIAEGKTGLGELGDQSYGNKDPLRETGYMLATLTYEVQE